MPVCDDGVGDLHCMPVATSLNLETVFNPKERGLVPTNQKKKNEKVLIIIYTIHSISARTDNQRYSAFKEKWTLS